MLMSGGTLTPNQLQNQRKPIVLRIWYSYQLLILTLHKLSKKSSSGHFLMNKMTVHLNMFCSSIHNWINCPVQDTHIITIQRKNRSKEHSKVIKKIQSPSQSCGSGSQFSILCFSTRSGYCVLFLGGPRIKICTQVDAIACS